MKGKKVAHNVDEWARLRFSVIGGLLSSPPPRGHLQEAFEELAGRRWLHPLDDNKWLTFTVSAIESWYYRARRSDDPLSALARQIRSDTGRCRVMNEGMVNFLVQQYKDHRNWSYQLHYDNLQAEVQAHPEMGILPSYSTVKRHMKGMGLRPRKIARKQTDQQTEGRKKAAERFEKLETRSYESPYVHGLWHLDFHHCSLKIIDKSGNWLTPKALCVLDDASRLCCHIQWYRDETSFSLIHGFIQALYKRGVPRALLTDNGSAMESEEFRNGLEKLGIVHKTTLPYSPHQNGKQEVMWAQLEGRLIKMLQNIRPLTLDYLNTATQAWIECEYNRRRHSELSMSPLDRMFEGPELSRPAPGAEVLDVAFCREVTRKQRHSDGTLTINGVRFEVPSRFRYLDRLTVRYRCWDLSNVFLVDQRSRMILARITPVDKKSNADGKRRKLDQGIDGVSPADKDGKGKGDRIPPLLSSYLKKYAATGLPPAYIPTEEPDVPEESADEAAQDDEKEE